MHGLIDRWVAWRVVIKRAIRLFFFNLDIQRSTNLKIRTPNLIFSTNQTPKCGFSSYRIPHLHRMFTAADAATAAVTHHFWNIISSKIPLSLYETEQRPSQKSVVGGVPTTPRQKLSTAVAASASAKYPTLHIRIRSRISKNIFKPQPQP